jgi:hypothetical protein
MKKVIVTLALATLMGVSSNAKALDVILSPFYVAALVTNNHPGAPMTVRYLGDGISTLADQAGWGFSLGLAVFVLPFTILNEESNSLSIDVEELAKMNYSASEISEYKTDLEKINGLSGKFTTEEDALAAFKSLDLGVIAREQIRL